MPTPLTANLGPLGRARGVTAIPWYLSGGIAAANCVAAYQPKGAASLTASYVNLANPGTNNAAPGVAPTWDATNGWVFSAPSSQYLTTGISPTDTSWSALIRFSGKGDADEWAFGLYTTNGWGIQPNFSAAHLYYDGATFSKPGGLASGVLGFAGKEAYNNGADDGTIGAGTFTPTDFYIGDVHFSGGHRYLTANVQAFAVYNTTLTAQQMAAVTTAMQAL